MTRSDPQFVETRKVLLALLEARGDRPGHRFHGNQFNGGGRAGGDEPSSTPTSAPAGRKLSRKEAVESLRASGYTGPVSFSVSRLNDIHAAHMASRGHPPAEREGVSSSAPTTSTKTPKLTTQNVRKAIEESIVSGTAHGGLDAKVKMAEKTNAPVTGSSRSKVVIGYQSAMTSGVQTKMRRGVDPDLGTSGGFNHPYVEVSMNFRYTNPSSAAHAEQIKTQRAQATKNVMSAVAAKGYRVHQGVHDEKFNRFEVHEARP